MTNGKAKPAILAVLILTLAGLVASTFVYSSSEEASAERIGIFIAAIFGFLTPTIGILLLIAQGKETADKVDTAAIAATAAAKTADRVANETSAYRVAKENVDVSTESAVVIRPHEETT